MGALLVALEAPSSPAWARRMQESAWRRPLMRWRGLMQHSNSLGSVSCSLRRTRYDLCFLFPPPTLAAWLHSARHGQGHTALPIQGTRVY